MMTLDDNTLELLGHDVPKSDKDLNKAKAISKSESDNKGYVGKISGKGTIVDEVSPPKDTFLSV